MPNEFQLFGVLVPRCCLRWSLLFRFLLESATSKGRCWMVIKIFKSLNGDLVVSLRWVPWKDVAPKSLDVFAM